MKYALFIGTALVVGSLARQPLCAQSATPENSTTTASAADAKPEFSGTWKLDASISFDPSKATFDPVAARSTQRYGGFGGGRGRGGIGGRRPARDSPSDDRTAEEKARLQALTDEIRKGARTLVISHHEPSFVINDAQNQTQFLKTDDSPTDQTVGAQTISSTAHWEGSHLVSEYTLSSREKLVFTYNLLAASQQMVLRVRLDDTERRRVLGQELKFVYTLAPAAAAR